MDNEWNKVVWKGKGKCPDIRERWTMNEIEVLWRKNGNVSSKEGRGQ